MFAIADGTAGDVAGYPAALPNQTPPRPQLWCCRQSYSILYPNHSGNQLWMKGPELPEQMRCFGKRCSRRRLSLETVTKPKSIAFPVVLDFAVSVSHPTNPDLFCPLPLSRGKELNRS